MSFGAIQGCCEAPLLLGDQATITRGVTVRFKSVNLAPKVLVPYEVASIRMNAYPSIDGGGDTSLRGFLKWQFMVGNQHPLTDSFIPMWNLTPARQATAELGGYFEWRFKRPLLLPPGARIDAQVQLQANTPNAGGTPTVTVAVSYAGRLRADLATFPEWVDMPFCGAWDTTVTGGATSNEWNSLRNPLKKALDIEMLIARIQSDESGGDASDAAEGNTLQIFDPYGRALHRFGPIQFHAMFPSDTKAFPYEGQLGADQHFSVRLTTPPSATDRPMISYLGSRRERFL